MSLASTMNGMAGDVVTENTIDGTVDKILDAVIASLPPARTGKSIEADYKVRIKKMFEQAKESK